MNAPNVGASVRARLLNRARETQQLSDVVAELNAFIMPAAAAAHAQLEFNSHWQASGPWSQHGAT